MEEKSSSKTQGKAIRCKAAVCRKPGEALVIEEIMVAPPMPGEVRVRIIWEDVDEVSEGDVVIPTFMSVCGECADCISKKSNLCSKYPFKICPWMPRYETSRFTDLKGQVLYHFIFVSSFSEYTVVDVCNVTKIDPAVPPNRACLLSCGISTGFGAAWKTAEVEKGSTVAIFGLGSIGLAVAEGARLCGAARIIGVDINPNKFEFGKFFLTGARSYLFRPQRIFLSYLNVPFCVISQFIIASFTTGKKFGVTDFVNAANCGSKSVSQPSGEATPSPLVTGTSRDQRVINEMSGGGADYCFECVGLASLVHEAYACCRKGWGKTIVVGVDKPGSKLSLSSFEVLHSGKKLMGSLFGGLKAKTDIPILLARYMNKELQLDEFVTHELQFEDINKAFDLLIEGECLRCVIWMQK
ncbi:hypothetical protein FEM48_Zijuj06G0011000 [Ziziphus jujuba var. spinosa]|uniref:Alcohol dehydrogenase-like C-terminal domain-containing protein n=1 Tax=Ziziphus jujuba var. spinosa TaxID=714518 RepID=A0A978V6A4_ZIZJJ|nr:hypothetical protein FEM48_Zijuj06G0011000 [Ziziphus jujuba var. spinosa]